MQPISSFTSSDNGLIYRNNSQKVPCDFCSTLIVSSVALTCFANLALLAIAGMHCDKPKWPDYIKPASEAILGTAIVTTAIWIICFPDRLYDFDYRYKKEDQKGCPCLNGRIIYRLVNNEKFIASLFFTCLGVGSVYYGIRDPLNDRCSSLGALGGISFMITQFALGMLLIGIEYEQKRFSH